MNKQELHEDDLVEITAIGKVESVNGNKVLVRVHGVIVPMLNGQLKRIPRESEEEAGNE